MDLLNKTLNDRVERKLKIKGKKTSDNPSTQRGTLHHPVIKDLMEEK